MRVCNMIGYGDGAMLSQPSACAGEGLTIWKRTET